MRYLAFAFELSDPSAGVEDVLKLSLPVKNKGRSVRGVSLFFKSDLEVVLALARGEGVICGITNKLLGGVLGRGLAEVSGLFGWMRLLGLIGRLVNSFKYYLTGFGRRVILSGAKFRELVVIPSLAGVL